MVRKWRGKTIKYSVRFPQTAPVHSKKAISVGIGHQTQPDCSVQIVLEFVYIQLDKCKSNYVNRISALYAHIIAHIVCAFSLVFKNRE